MHNLQNEEWLIFQLFLVAVDIIIDYWVAAPLQALCLLNHMKERPMILGSRHGFKRKRLFRMNLMIGNIDNISHVTILIWPDMTSPLTSHGPLNDNTQNLFLKSFMVLSFDTSNVEGMLSANQYYRNLPFISINVSFRKTVQLKTFLWIFPYPNFIKNTIAFDQIVQMLGLCTVYFKSIPHCKFYCNFWIHNLTIKCC